MATLSSNQLTASSYEKALQNFRLKSGLTTAELATMEMTTLTELQKSLAVLQKSQQQSKTMLYLRRLQPFLDAMEQYGKVVEIFVNTSNLVAFVWGPMKYVLLIASNVSEAFNTLLDGYLAIGEHLPLLVQYQQLFDSNQYMRTALTSIFEDILEFQLEAVKIFRQRRWRDLFIATQRSLKKKIDEISKSMQRHKSIIEAQATVVQYEEFEATRMLLKTEFATMRAAERDHRTQRVQTWLGSSIDSLLRHEHLKKDRFGNTGQWLLDDQRFKNWFAPSQCIDPLLWLHGMPGAGKTVLASRVIEEARCLPETVTICFYCMHTDDQKSGFVSLAKSLLAQILAQDNSVLDYIYDQMSGSGEATLVSTDLAKNLLRISLESCKKSYIVIDGLDEYSRENRKEIASWFQHLIQSLPTTDVGSLRCLFVSQEDGCARKDLSMLSQIKLTPDATKSDIQDFCYHWHEKIERKFGPLVRPEHWVKSVVSARAQGMFLYAKLVTWNLHEQISRATFEAEMDPRRIPLGLNQAYDRVIERLLGSQVATGRRVNVQRLLGWLTCSKRSLKWAMAVNTDTGSFSINQQFEEDCQDLCASLVEVFSDGTVMLIHSTTRQYLIDNNWVQVPNVHYELAIICTTHLSLPEFEREMFDDEIKAAYLRGIYSFADYATCYWPLHLELSLRDPEKRRDDSLEVVLECFETFLNMHWMTAGKSETVSTTLQDGLIVMKDREYYDRACEAVATAKSWLRPASKGPDDKNVLHLPHTFSRIRTIAEDTVASLTPGSDAEQRVRQQYGSGDYKCSRMNCQFYYRGFITASERDQHKAKHERSFTCTWDGCPYEIFGFVTSKDLQKHVIEQHGVTVEIDELEFPSEHEATSQHAQKHPGRYDCNLCARHFTRVHNLKSHLLTHSGERPFSCAKCPSTFTRRNELNRHVAKLHPQ